MNNKSSGDVFSLVVVVLLGIILWNVVPDDAPVKEWFRSPSEAEVKENYFDQAVEWIGNWIIENPVEFWGNVAVVAFVIVASIIGKMLWPAE